MGTSWFVGRLVKGYLGLLPQAYAEKTARKLRFYLDAYSGDGDVLASSVGPLKIAGVRRSLGQAADVSLQEPETIRWVDTFVGVDDVMWDVGGNIGLYSVYAAKRGTKRIYAFEPFAATHLQLVKNLVANGVDANVRALSIALSDKSGIADLALRSFEAGYATSLAATEFASDQVEKQIGTQYVATLTATDFLASEPDAAPDHIKIDVDGAEPLILRGLMPILPSIKSLFIEVLDVFETEFERDFLPQILAAGLIELPIGQPSKARNRVFVRPGTYQAGIVVL
jgi:FkbM family methyltransferase